MDYYEKEELLDLIQSRFREMPACAYTAWRQFIAPAIFQRAENESFDKIRVKRALQDSLQIVWELLVNLHPLNWTVDDDADKPKYIWRHQEIDLKPLSNNRCKDIQRESLFETANSYLSQPDIKCDYLDWVFLDSITYQEYQAFLMHPIANIRFSGWGFFLLYVAPLLASFTFFISDSRNLGLTFFIIFLISVVSGLVRIPRKRDHKKMVMKSTAALDTLYRDLSGNIVSSSKLRESLKTAVSSEVVLDGSVFVIADRLKGDSLRNNWIVSSC